MDPLISLDDIGFAETLASASMLWWLARLVRYLGGLVRRRQRPVSDWVIGCDAFAILFLGPMLSLLTTVVILDLGYVPYLSTVYAMGAVYGIGGAVMYMYLTRKRHPSPKETAPPQAAVSRQDREVQSHLL